MCEVFSCTPAQALEQDRQLCINIMEYRQLCMTKAQHNVDATKITEGQARLWGEMLKSDG